MRKLIRLLSLLSVLAAIATPFQAEATPTQGVSAFVFHPTHCQVFLGGESHAGDALSAEYAESLSVALDSQPDDVAAVLATIEQHCNAGTNSPESVSAARAKVFILGFAL